MGHPLSHETTREIPGNPSAPARPAKPAPSAQFVSRYGHSPCASIHHPCHTSVSFLFRPSRRLMPNCRYAFRQARVYVHPAVCPMARFTPSWSIGNLASLMMTAVVLESSALNVMVVRLFSP